MRQVVLLTLGTTLALALAAGSARAERVENIEDFSRLSLANDVIPSPCPGPQCTAELQEPYVLGPRVIFLAFEGVSLTRSTTNEDARNNISAIVNSSTEVISPFDPYDLSSTGGMSRSQIISATQTELERLYSPYDVTFTTTRPSTGNYHMLVFGGSSVGVLGDNGAAGVSLGDCGDTMANNIVFIFTEVSGMRVGDMSTTAAHELGHSLGLSHINDTDAVMYYSITSLIPDHWGQGTIPDQPVCSGQSYQDSGQQIMEVIGPRGQDVSPPVVTITSPSAGSTAYYGDAIRATASDATGVDYLEAQIAGVTISQDNSAPYEWTIPLDAPTGEQAIRVRAYDTKGLTSFDQVVVTIVAGEAPPCHSQADCDPGEICDENQKCVPDGFGDGELGAPCFDQGSCNSPYFCATVGEEQRCSSGCDDANPCPEGFDCMGACWPSATEEDDGGGCFGSVSNTSDTKPSLAIILLFAFGLVFVLRRKRR